MDSSLDWPEGESDQPAEEPEAEDDKEEPLHEEPTAAEIVQAGVARGQLDVAKSSSSRTSYEIAASVTLVQITVLAPPPSQSITFDQCAARWLI